MKENNFEGIVFKSIALILKQMEKFLICEGVADNDNCFFIIYYE